MPIRHCCFAFLLSALLPVRDAGAETVPVYTNATFAPLVIDARRGLYPEMVAYLNRRKMEGIDFKLEYLPRKRLQVLLESRRLDGIVIGMMPKWFGDDGKNKYLWTAPFFFDSFVLVSPATKPLRHDMSTGLDGARIGMTLGYVYPGIDEWMARHNMARDDAPNEEKNIEKMVRRRVDAVVVSASVLRQYRRTHPGVAGLSISPLPGRQIERSFLIPLARRDLLERLTPVIKHLEDDPAWREIRDRYQ